jgi:hypothetical protein
MHLGLQSGSFFGYTPDGQHYRVDQVGTSKLIRTKPTVNSYLKKLLKEVAMEEKQKEEKQFKLLKSVCWFEVGGGKDYLRGSFDLELYNKVLKAKSEYVYRCPTCGDKFRPGNGIEIMGFTFCNICTEADEHIKYILEAPSAKDNRGLLFDLICNPKHI